MFFILGKFLFFLRYVNRWKNLKKVRVIQGRNRIKKIKFKKHERNRWVSRLGLSELNIEMTHIFIIIFRVNNLCNLQIYPVQN